MIWLFLSHLNQNIAAKYHPIHFIANTQIAEWFHYAQYRRHPAGFVPRHISLAL